MGRAVQPRGRRPAPPAADGGATPQARPRARGRPPHPPTSPPPQACHGCPWIGAPKHAAGHDVTAGVAWAGGRPRGGRATGTTTPPPRAKPAVGGERDRRRDDATAIAVDGAIAPPTENSSPSTWHLHH